MSTKGVEKLVLAPFQKVKIEYISGSIIYSFTVLISIACQTEIYRNILKLSCRPLVFSSCKTFLNKKGGLELGDYSAIFSA